MPPSRRSAAGGAWEVGFVPHDAAVMPWGLLAQGTSFLDLIVGAGLFVKFILLLLLGAAGAAAD